METNKKIRTISEYLIFLIIPLTIFLYLTIRNKNRLEQASIASQKQQELIKTENALINDGLVHIKQKKYKQSIAINLKVIAINKNNKNAYNNIGIAYANLKEWDKGIEYCSKALSIDPGFQLAKNNINWMKNEKKN